MASSPSINPDPSKSRRVGYPEKLSQSLAADALEWDHPAVNHVHEEKTRKGSPPAVERKRRERAGHPPDGNS